MYSVIYSMYANMYEATFTGKQLSHLQEVKDFYTNQVSVTYMYMYVHTCTLYVLVHDSLGLA